jgi:hypothetical protein
MQWYSTDGRDNGHPKDPRRELARTWGYAPRLSEVLRRHRLDDGATANHDLGDRGSPRKGAATLRHLALLPGVYRLHRVPDPQPFPHGREPDSRYHLPGLSPHPPGRLRRRRRGGPPRGHEGELGLLFGGGGRLPAGTRLQHGLLHHRRPQQSGHSQGDGGRGGGGSRRGHLRRLWRSAPRLPQSHRRRGRAGHHYQQAHHQRLGLSADSHRHYRRSGPVPDLWHPAGNGRLQAAPGLFRSVDPRPLLSPALL